MRIANHVNIHQCAFLDAPETADTRHILWHGTHMGKQRVRVVQVTSKRPNALWNHDVRGAFTREELSPGPLCAPKSGVSLEGPGRILR